MERADDAKLAVALRNRLSSVFRQLSDETNFVRSPIVPAIPASASLWNWSSGMVFGQFHRPGDPLGVGRVAGGHLLCDVPQRPSSPLVVGDGLGQLHRPGYSLGIGWVAGRRLLR